MLRRGLVMRTLMVAAVAISTGSGLALALDEMPKDIIAAHIRMQGFTCDKPISAERDSAASKPNETVWHLKCEDHSYRVRLAPDMAADVRPID
jgi:hypothetical protein